MKRFFAIFLVAYFWPEVIYSIQPNPNESDAKRAIRILEIELENAKKSKIKSTQFSSISELEKDVTELKGAINKGGIQEIKLKTREILFKFPSDPLNLPPKINAVLGDHRFRQPGKTTGCLCHPNQPIIISWGEDGSICSWDSLTGRPISRIFAHSDSVHQVVFHPAQPWIASTGEDRLIALWDLDTGKKLKSLELTGEPANSIAFSADGELIACGGKDRKIKILNTKEWKIQHDLTGHNLGITSVCFHPSKPVVASVSADRSIRLTDAKTGNVLGASTPFRGTIYSVKYSLDGSFIALAGSEPNAIKILDSTSLSEKQSFEIHQGPIHALELSKDGKMAISTGADQALKVWDLQNNKSLQAFTLEQGEIRSLSLSPEGSIIYGAGNHSSLHAWSLEKSQQNYSLFSGKSPLWCVSWSPDGNLIASAGSDKIIRVWSYLSKKEIIQLKGHDAPITSLAFHPNSDSVASAGADKTLRIWQLKQGGNVQVLRSHTATITCLAYSPDGKHLVTGGADQMLTLWKPPEEKPIRTWHVKTTVSSIVWPDSNSDYFYWAGGDRAVHAFDFQSGTEIWSGSVPGDFVTSLCKGALGNQFFASTSNAKLALIENGPGKTAKMLTGFSGILSSSDANVNSKKLAAAGADQNIYLWQLKNLEKPIQWRAHDDWISSLAFKPDGNSLASTSMDGQLKIWNLGTEAKFIPSPGHGTEIKSMAASDKGRLLASTSSEGVLCLWDVANSKLLGVQTDNSETLSSLAFSKDENFLVAGNNSGDLLVYTTTPFKLTRRISNDTRSEVLSLLLLPNNQALSLISPNVLEVRDLNTGSLIQKFTIPALSSTPSCITFFPGGNSFLVGTKDGKIIFLKLGEEAPGPNKVFPILDEQIIELNVNQGKGNDIFALSKSGVIRVWNQDTLKAKTIVDGKLSITAFVLSPSGDKIAAITQDGGVKCLESTTGKIIHEWKFPSGQKKGSTNSVNLQWSGDSSWLFLGNRDGTIFQLDPK